VFTKCDATIGTDHDGVGSVEVRFDDRVPWVEESTATERGGVTVYVATKVMRRLADA
jgi:hypothetical protein